MIERTSRSPAPTYTETPDGRTHTNPKSQPALSVVLVVVALLLTLPFRSISLDDFDSYSFALALDDYNLRLQQPQPPGFPVYIALARAICRLRPDPVFALTMLSAISGVGSVWLIYQLGRRLDPRHRFTAVGAAIVFGLVPVSWLSSGKALTDMPGLAWTLLCLWLWVRWRMSNSPRAAYVASLVTGISLGVRPQNALPVALLVGAYFVQDVVQQRSRRRPPLITVWLTIAAAGLAGAILWLIPAAAASGGLRSYLSLVSTHAGHVERADSLLGMDQPLARALRIRLVAFADTGLTALTGTGLFYLHDGDSVWATHTLLRVFAWGIGVLPGLLFADWRRRQTRWLGIWWLAGAVQILIFETLDRPRLLLPLLPPLLLLTAAGWARIIRRRSAGAILLSAVFLAVVSQTLPLAATLSQVPAAPAQATEYIATNYPPDRTIVAAAGSFRAAQLDLPGYALIYLYTFDPEAVAARLASGVDYVAILDRDQFTPEAIATLSRKGTLVTVEERLFSRDRRVHTQHDQVRLQVLASPDRVPAQALELPADGCLDLGTEDDGRYLGEGWFRAEEVAGTTARWSGGDLSATVRLMIKPEAGLSLRFRVLPYGDQQTVTAMLDNQAIGTVNLGRDWSEATMDLPLSLLTQEEPTRLELRHAFVRSPFETTNGASSDRRELAAAYDWICVTSTQAGPGGD